MEESYQRKPSLLGIIRIQFIHYSKSWTSQHTGKARCGFKITSNDGKEDFKKDINKTLKEIQKNTSNR
jgi:DNA replication protein DnaD